MAGSPVSDSRRTGSWSTSSASKTVRWLNIGTSSKMRRRGRSPKAVDRCSATTSLTAGLLAGGVEQLFGQALAVVVGQRRGQEDHPIHNRCQHAVDDLFGGDVRVRAGGGHQLGGLVEASAQAVGFGIPRRGGTSAQQRSVDRFAVVLQDLGG